MEDQRVASAREVERAGQGDDEALGRLYDRHAAVVLSLCRLRLRHHASITDAEDCCHETFLRALARLDEVHDPAGFRSWLYAIARNVCAEHNRGERRRRARETEYGRMAHMTISMTTRAGCSDSPAARNGAVGAAMTVEQRAITEERLAHLSRAMRDLPPRERLVLHLHYLDPDPVAAAQEAMGMSRSAFYRTLHRARSLLATALRESRD